MTLMVVPGSPGEFSGGAAPDNMAEIRAIGALGQVDAWTDGQYVLLANSRKVHWGGDQWAIGAADKKAPVDEGSENDKAPAPAEVAPTDTKEWERIQAVIRNAP